MKYIYMHIHTSMHTTAAVYNLDIQLNLMISQTIYLEVSFIP